MKSPCAVLLTCLAIDTPVVVKFPVSWRWILVTHGIWLVCKLHVLIELQCLHGANNGSNELTGKNIDELLIYIIKMNVWMKDTLTKKKIATCVFIVVANSLIKKQSIKEYILKRNSMFNKHYFNLTYV